MTDVVPVVLAGLITWQLMAMREPVYQGKPLSAWLEQYGSNYGKEQRVLTEIAGLKPPRGETGKIVRTEKNYFAGQSGPGPMGRVGVFSLNVQFY